MRARHKKLQQVAQGLYLCTDRRSTSESKMEGSSGGAGYIYLGFENPQQKIAANTRRLVRLGHKK